MTITTQLHTNPHGRFGGADFEVELAPPSEPPCLQLVDQQLQPEASGALAELARGLEEYAANPDQELGALPSAIFAVTKLHGDFAAADLAVYRLAGVFAASDFHKRIQLPAQTA